MKLLLPEKEEGLQKVLDILNQADRIGAQEDSPEGSRYIQISDTLAAVMITALESALE